MKLAEYSVRRPITVAMAVLSVLVLGVISLQRLPLALLPDMEGNSLSVNVSYPSSSPIEVERDISRPLEEVLSTINGLESIRSSSSSNGSNVRLEFKQGFDMDMVSLEVRDRLDQVRNRLPDEVERVSIRRWQTTDMPVMRLAVAWGGDRKDFYSFVQEVLRPRMERIDGVANVDVRGLDTKQIIVDLDPDLLQAYGVDLFTLSQALRSNNVNLSGGYVVEGEKKFSLRTVGEFTDVSDIADFPLMGGRITLSDLGDVRYDFPEKTSYSRLNSEDSVSLSVRKATTANVVSVCRLTRAEVESIKNDPQFSDVFSYRIYRDSSEDITKSINNLATAGLFGGGLAAVVLFLFLMKLRSTLIITLAIPISAVFTFAFMYLLRVLAGSDISLNVVSMMGLMVAVGMLVDASVVVLENIFRHKQEKGLNAFQAAISGSQEVGVAVLASVSTTVIVFLSFIFVEESMTSRWTRDFGLTVSIALVASLVVALTLVPMISSRLFTGKEKPKQKALVLMNDFYGGIMSFMLRRRYVALVMMAGLGWGSWILVQSIDRDLMPQVSERHFEIEVRIERSYSLEDMKNLFVRLESQLLGRKEEFEIDSVSSDFSDSTSRRGTYRGELDIFLTEDGTGSPQELSERIKSSLPVVPGVEYKFGRRRHYGGGGEMGVEVQLKGEDPGLLELYGEAVKSRLESLPGVKDVQTTMETGDDEIHLKVDRKKAEQFGISPMFVARTISSALSTRATTRLKGDNAEIDVIVQMRGGNRISLQEVENFRFENREGEMIPIYSVVDYTYEKGPLAISREDRKATLSVVGNTEGAGMMRMSGMLDQALADLKLPPGYSWSQGRSYRRWRESEDSNNFSIILAIILMYIIMASLFESFVHPLTILFTVPFSIIGVAGLFYLTGTNLDSMAYLGILVLFGLVVNNGIIFIDHINTLRAEGLGRDQAILQGGRDRLRPILMTACTSLFGMFPLVAPTLFPSYFPGVGGRAGMWAPVSLAVFGGLTTSTFLTLIILPTVYSYMDDASTLSLKFARFVLRLLRRLPFLSQAEA
jgi:HAE1 family hydrophobic/amphiphilic exporter-1